VLLLIVDWTKI